PLRSARAGEQAERSPRDLEAETQLKAVARDLPRHPEPPDVQGGRDADGDVVGEDGGNIRGEEEAETPPAADDQASQRQAERHVSWTGQAQDVRADAHQSALRKAGGIPNVRSYGRTNGLTRSSSEPSTPRRGSRILERAGGAGPIATRRTAASACG